MQDVVDYQVIADYFRHLCIRKGCQADDGQQAHADTFHTDSYLQGTFPFG